MTRRVKRPKGSGLRKIRLDPAASMPLLAEAGCIADAGLPYQVYGYMDASGNPRRILAHFLNGWRCDVRFHVDGSYSITQSGTFTVGGKVAGA